MSVNKVILVGRLGQNPEIRAAQSGVSVANLSLATNHTVYDGNGNKQESTEWHSVVFFGRTAEVCQEYLTKGSQIYVEGRLQTNKYTDKDGIERYRTSVIGERMQMLGGGENGQQRQQQPQQSQPQQQPQSSGYKNAYAQQKGRNQPMPQRDMQTFEDIESDLPF